MTTSDPEQPSQPFGATGYPSLEDYAPQPDPNPPVDYPPDAGLPPPVYPPPYPGAPGYPGYPGYSGYPGVPGYYPGAYDPYRPMKPPGTNGMAIAALAVSLGSLVLFCGIPSIVAVILGVVAMSQTRHTDQEGFGLALAGTIIGAVPTVFWLLFLLLFIGGGWQWAP
jgi:Domain of unknown function (DUF4190)